MHPRFRVASARAAIRESGEKTPSLDRIPKKLRRWSVRQFQSQVMKKEEDEDDDVHWMCRSHIKKAFHLRSSRKVRISLSAVSSLPWLP
jgi:ribosomal 50S subunit-associated protein YjgA (DUF615 family)